MSISNIKTFKELNKLSRISLIKMYYEITGYIDVFHTKKFYRDYIIQYCEEDDTPLC